MGTSHSIVSALQAVLNQRELKVTKNTLQGFVEEIKRIAPWFTYSGSLTVESWEKLGADLIKEQQGGKLRAGTMPLWKLVRTCLKDKKCQTIIEAGQKVLEEFQESVSEAEWGSASTKETKDV